MSMKVIVGSLQDEINVISEELTLYGYSLEDLGLLDKIGVEDYIINNANREGSAYDFEKAVNDLVGLMEESLVGVE